MHVTVVLINLPYFELWQKEIKPAVHAYCMSRVLRCFRDPIRIPRIRENYHRVPKDAYRAPNIFIKKKNCVCLKIFN